MSLWLITDRRLSHCRCAAGEKRRKAKRMPRRKERNFITFNDGILDVCQVKNRKIIRTKIKGLRFGYRTVGVKRFYEAKVVSDKIDEVVSIPQSPQITTLDICIIRGIQYKIVQTQNQYDSLPASTFLSLERIVTLYEDVRESG